MVDKDIEIGKIFINSEKSHFGAGRAPVGHEQSSNSSVTERGNETVSGSKIGNGRPMQRERCAEQGGDAALGRRKVPQPDCLQLERNLAWRSSFRLLRGAAAIRIAGKSQKKCCPGRRNFTGRRSGERRPEERRIRELTSWIPIHLKACPVRPCCLELAQFHPASRLSESYALAANKSHRPGRPLSSSEPRSVNFSPVPATRSVTTLETITSPGWDWAMTRAAACTAMPPTS